MLEIIVHFSSTLLSFSRHLADVISLLHLSGIPQNIKIPNRKLNGESVIMGMYYQLVSMVLTSLALQFGRISGDGESVLIGIRFGETKTLMSPNYPHAYNSNVVNYWVVKGEKGRRLKLTFNDFHTEDTDDLRVDDTYPIVDAKYRGKQSFPPYISLGYRLNLTFRNIDNVSEKGFNLSISHFLKAKNNTLHEAQNGTESTRIMTQSVCRGSWNMTIADVVCREAGFPGAYESQFLNGSENTSESGDHYSCDRMTYSLEDCDIRANQCYMAHGLPVIKCNAVSLFGCYDLVGHAGLLEQHVNLDINHCVAHCSRHHSTAQYAIHHNGTKCSCVDQASLNLNNLRVSLDPDECRTADARGEIWASVFNASFGFCGRPAPLLNGNWRNSSDGYGYMYGTSITAECNDGYELDGGDEVLKCGRATSSSSSPYFEWQGNIPSCLERITGTPGMESLAGSVTPSSASPQNTSEPSDTGSSSFYGKVLGIPLSVVVVVMSILLLVVIIIIIIIRRKDTGDLKCGLWWSPTCIQGERSRVTQEESSRYSVLHGVSSITTVLENEYMSSVQAMTGCSYSTSPTSFITNTSMTSMNNIHHPMRSDTLPIDDQSTVSMTRSASDIQHVVNFPQHVPRVEDITLEEPVPLGLPIHHSTRTLPLTRVKTTAPPPTPVSPLNVRPLPARPISTDRTYAEPTNQSDPSNPCQPTNNKHIFQDHEYMEPTDIDVSAIGVRLPRQPLRSAAALSSSFPKRGAHTVHNESSSVPEPCPYGEPLTTLHTSGSSSKVPVIQEEDVASDSSTSSGSPLSEELASTINQDKHDYEDVDTQMDRPTRECKTPNHADSAVSISDKNFETSRRQTVRNSSSSEKYYSVHEPQPQNDSKEVPTDQDSILREKAASPHDPFYFKLEREETRNSTDSGVFTSNEDFDSRMRQTVRSSSCSETKYCSVHYPQPQNDSKEISIDQDYISGGKTASFQVPVYFTLEREGEDTTEMIDNPLYESTEHYP